MLPPLFRLALAVLASSALCLQASVAQDAPPVDTAKMLQGLRAIKDRRSQEDRAQRQKLIQDAQLAASNPSRAAEIWTEAVRSTQFEGSDREGPKFREWRDKEGSVLMEKEVQNALRLYFNWLALSLRRANGTPVRELLPAVIQHTKDATAARIAAEALEEQIKREKELVASGRHGGRDRKNDDELTKRVYDQIVSRPLPGSVVVQSLRIVEALKPPPTGKALEGSWELTPGNTDGIFESIIVPELRQQRDPRLLEYWDVKMGREADAAAKSKLAFELEKFNQVRRPQLLWSRAQDIKALGQNNRAINEMFDIIKTYPDHPNAAAWVGSLEQALGVSPPATSADQPSAAAEAE